MRKRLINCFISLALIFGPGLTAFAQETVSMDGKTALVTGSTSGLGKEVAMRLGAMGAEVLVHGRSAERGQEVVDAINEAGPGSAVFYQADLGSLDQVRALADRVSADHDSLHLLINNAGILGTGDAGAVESADGYELTFAVNYLSHFVLTRELLPLLQAGTPSRIVHVSSVAQQPVNFDTVMLTDSYNMFGAYSQSKLAMILFSNSLAEQLDADSITSNSLHPATSMNTPMVTNSGMQPMATVEEGADAVMQLAVGSALAGRTGLYFNQMDEARANEQAYDEAARVQLWALSEELTQ
jgi:NAD(P)-dependent dehydrogenase (short-subunit alcohol dehydrogenase family)